MTRTGAAAFGRSRRRKRTRGSLASVKHQVPHDLAPGSGWSISPDGAQVEITGSLCDDAKGGRFTSITFQYPCKSGEPLTPLTPVPQ